MSPEFATTKQGVEVVRGNPSDVHPGVTLVIDGRTVRIKSVGKPFPLGTETAVYGYLAKAGEPLPDTRPDDGTMLTCEICGTRFTRNPGPGRPPKYCPEHRGTTQTPNPSPVPVPSRPVAVLPEEEEENATPVPPVSPAVPVTATTADTHDLEAMLSDAIRGIAGTVAQSVDKDSVVALVNETIATAVDGFKASIPEMMAQAGIRRVEIKFAERVAGIPETAHELLPEVVQIIGAGLHSFLVGPAGSGKSTIAYQVSEIMGWTFSALSLGPTTPTSKLFGYMDATGNYVTTPFRKVYEFGGIMLMDELDNGHPGLVAEINQALANGFCAFADGMVAKHKDFRMIATGNTFGKGPDRMFVGRNILDAATLDRFATVEIPVDEAMERRIALSFVPEEDREMFATVSSWVEYVQAVRARAIARKLPVVVSPRSSIDGAKLLLAGMARDRVAEVRLFAGMDSATRGTIA